MPWNYWPFVRLAFARYQHDSLAEARLSPITIGEFGQPAPDRALSPTWTGPLSLEATLRGRAPVSLFAPRVALRIQTADPGTGPDPDELDWEHAAGHAPEVKVEELEKLFGPGDAQPDGEVEWKGGIELPAPRASQPMRLEVAEYELLQLDPDLGRMVARMTYAAHVALD